MRKGVRRMWMDAVLLIVLCVCTITDLKCRRIYNKVIFPGLGVIFVLRSWLEGWSGLADAAIGFLAGMGLLLIPYLMGGMGPGDVKLLALVGASHGAWFVLVTSVYMALLGGLIALCILLFRKGAWERIRWLGTSLYALRYGIKMPLVHKETLESTYPYGVAIAGGAVLCLWLKGGGIG